MLVFSKSLIGEVYRTEVNRGKCSTCRIIFSDRTIFEAILSASYLVFYSRLRRVTCFGSPSIILILSKKSKNFQNLNEKTLEVPFEN